MPLGFSWGHVVSPHLMPAPWAGGRPCYSGSFGVARPPGRASPGAGRGLDTLLLLPGPRDVLLTLPPACWVFDWIFSSEHSLPERRFPR